MNIEHTDFEVALTSIPDKTKLKGVFSDEELEQADEEITNKINRLHKQLDAVRELQKINKNI